MEYLLVATFLLLLTLPIIVLYYKESINFNDEITISQTNKALNRIASAADTVYYLGPPSKRTIEVYFPENVKNITIVNSSITASVGSGGKYVMSVESESDLNGSLSTFPGLHTVTIESKGNVTQIIG